MPERDYTALIIGIAFLAALTFFFAYKGLVNSTGSPQPTGFKLIRDTEGRVMQIVALGPVSPGAIQSLSSHLS